MKRGWLKPDLSLEFLEAWGLVSGLKGHSSGQPYGHRGLHLSPSDGQFDGERSKKRQYLMQEDPARHPHCLCGQGSPCLCPTQSPGLNLLFPLPLFPACPPQTPLVIALVPAAPDVSLQHMATAPASWLPVLWPQPPAFSSHQGNELLEGRDLAYLLLPELAET